MIYTYQLLSLGQSHTLLLSKDHGGFTKLSVFATREAAYRRGAAHFLKAQKAASNFKHDAPTLYADFDNRKVQAILDAAA